MCKPLSQWLAEEPGGYGGVYGSSALAFRLVLAGRRELWLVAFKMKKSERR